MTTKSKWAAVAAMVSGVFASACCLGPLSLAAIGLSGAGFAQLFSPYRPYFMGATFLFLGGSFLYTFKPVKQKEGEVVCLDCEAPGKRARTRMLLGIVTLLALGFAFFPYAGEKWAKISARTSAVSPYEVVLTLKGMSCPSCAVEIQNALKKVPGVQSAKVEYKTQKAIVGTRENMDVSQLILAVKNTGYKADVVEQNGNKN